MRLLIVGPLTIALLAVLVSFALSNAQPATLALWPTGFTLSLPLSVAILAAMAAAFFAGALMLWFSAMSARYRARHAEDRVRMLQAQLADATRSTTSALPPPT
jgi:uncharacterized integral membrane protein